jgi:hypothetical protein
MNEYGVIDASVEAIYEEQIEKLEGVLERITKELDLNGEEIRQLYDDVTSRLGCRGSEQIIRWSIKRRKQLREEAKACA